MSDDPQVRYPRLVPPPRAARARLVVVLAACAAVAVLGTSILNRSRFTLECEDGQLVAYRGLSLPVGRSRLDPDAYPAVAVPPAACVTVVASSREELEQHYVAATMQRIDTAIRSDDAVELESAAQVVDRLVGSHEIAPSTLDERKRALLVALARADLRAAAGALQRARDHLRAADEAGVPEDVLQALRLEVDGLCTADVAAVQPEPAEDPPALDDDGSRAL